MDPKKNLSIGQIIFTIIYVPFWPALFLCLSGDWGWIEGWIFAIWFLGITIGVTVYLYFKDPTLLAERYRKPGTGNQKGWDLLLFAPIMLIFLAWIIIIPLDSKRYSWSANYPHQLKYLGILLLTLSSFFLFRAFTDNTFLSPLVRLQEERKQYLITSGVYGFVRHPMYLGAILMFFGVPLLAGSYYGLALGLLMTLLIAVRTIGEEKMLMGKFEDYKIYKQKVKYRFIPYVW